MPIKPENRDRYPANWRELRAKVLDRAGHRCEWPGCGAHNYAAGYWDRDGFVMIATRITAVDPRTTLQLAARGHKLIRIVLTIAHLDHVPEHCDLDNLRAWCQRHHLAYDAEHHRTTAYMTRKTRAATPDLFGDITT